jgi:alpha/beta superfamily hydrolase
VSVNEDAEAAWHYLTTVRQFPNHRVFIYDHSLGAAIAIELAIHHEDAGGLIAEGAFTARYKNVAAPKRHEIRA